MLFQRTLVVSIFAGIGAMLYALYDMGVLFFEMTLSLNEWQKLLCIFVNVGVLAGVSIVISVPFSFLPIREGNQNWAGLLIGYITALAIGIFFPYRSFVYTMFALIACVLVVIALIVFAIYKDADEKIKMGSVLFICFGSLGSMAGNVPKKARYGVAPPNAPNVLLISVDALRFDHLSMNGHPFVNTDGISRLSSEGISLENAFAQTTKPFDGYEQLMYGTYPWGNNRTTAWLHLS